MTSVCGRVLPCSCCRRRACASAGARAGRGQRLHLSRNQADPAAVRRLHQGHRHQGQRDLGQLRPRAAHQDRRRQQPGRRAAHRRHQPPRRRGAAPASPSRSSPRLLDKVVRAAIPRSGRPLVRASSMRARVVYASKERVKQTAITYEELADPKWKGKICIRSGQHIYNNALFAALHRQARRGQGRGMAAAASRPIWRRSRPAATARPRATSRPASATSASATPITGR